MHLKSDALEVALSSIADGGEGRGEEVLLKTFVRPTPTLGFMERENASNNRPLTFFLHYASKTTGRLLEQAARLER